MELDTFVEAKICPECEEVKSLDEFNKDSRRSQGCSTHCKKCWNRFNNTRRKKRKELGLCRDCDNPIAKHSKTYCLECLTKANERERVKLRKNPRWALWKRAKKRAIEQNVPFSITKDDIIIPDRCPILGITLEIGQERQDSSPSLDKVVPHLGYVPGNIAVISWRANRIKSDATLQELKNIVGWMENYDNKSTSN